MGAPRSPTAAVANSEPSSQGSGSPPNRASTPPMTAAARVAAPAARRRWMGGGGSAGASAFMLPRRLSVTTGPRRRLRGGRHAHVVRHRHRLVGAVEELDGHEHHLPVAEVLQVVHLELARPVGLVPRLARLIGVFD